MHLSIGRSELRWALRSLTRRATASIIAVSSLSVGILVLLVTYIIVDRADIKTLPYADAQRLVTIRQSPTAECPTCRAAPSFSDFQYWTKQSRLMDGIAAYQGTRDEIEDGGSSSPIWIGATTTNLASVLGVRPVLGRFLSSDDAGGAGESSIVLSFDAWQTRFSGDRDVLGRHVVLGSGEKRRTMTVVGVMPRSFAIPPGVDVWQPLSVEEVDASSTDVAVVGRLRPSASSQALEAELAALWRRQEAGAQAKSKPFVVGLRAQLIEDAHLGGGRFVLLAIGISALLLTVVNLMSQMYSQFVVRLDEFAVRIALGANARMLAVQPALEIGLLVIAAGSIATFCAAMVTPYASKRLGVVAAGIDVNFGFRDVGFAFAVTAICGLILVATSVARIGRLSLRQSLKVSRATLSKGTRKKQGLAVVFQVSAALTLVSVATMLAQEFQWLRFQAPGYDPTGVRFVPVLGLSKTAPLEDMSRSLGSALRGRVAVQSAEDRSVQFSLYGETEPIARKAIPFRYVVTDDYFGTLKIPMIRGREFAASDAVGTPLVGIVNRAAAARLWPGHEAVGQTLVVRSPSGSSDRVSIVGVVENTRVFTVLGGPAQPIVYRPSTQAVSQPLNLFLRTSADVKTVHRVISAALQSTGYRDLAPSDVKEMTAYLDRETTTSRSNASLLGIVSTIQLLLAALGIYSLGIETVSSRRREIATRSALGGRPGHIMMVALWQAVFSCLIGLAIGTAIVVAVRKTVVSLFALSVSFDVVPIVLGGIVLLTVSLVAVVTPARMALRISPASVLRE